MAYVTYSDRTEILGGAELLGIQTMIIFFKKKRALLVIAKQNNIYCQKTLRCIKISMLDNKCIPYGITSEYFLSYLDVKSS